MTDRPWLSSYPQGVPADIDPSQYASLVGLMEESFSKYADRTAYSFMGKDVSYAETDKLSKAFAAYLQGLGLAKGDRVAAMMPNCPQYPIAVAAILRAGRDGTSAYSMALPISSTTFLASPKTIMVLSM